MKTSAAKGISLYREFCKSFNLKPDQMYLNKIMLWPEFLKENYWRIYEKRKNL